MNKKSAESAAIPAARNLDGSNRSVSLEFLRDLADVLEKHKGGIDFVSDSASNEIGFYVTQGGGWDAWKSKVWIGWPENGNSEIGSAIKILEARLDDPNEDVPETEQEVFDALYKKEWQEQSMREDKVPWDDSMLNDDDYK